jgi:hypothetical protein
MSKQADGGRDGSDGVDLAIESLCIFSTELGQQEGREKDKVLFYYPTETDVYRQTRNAGLAAAMVGFTGQFSPEQPVEAVVTQKTIQSFYCCEEGCRVPHSQVPGKRPSVWLVLTVRKGAALRPAAGGSSSSKGKAAAPLPPETEGGADDRVLRVHELARLCWQTFTMFHCSAESIIQRAGTMVDPPLTKADIKAGIDGWAPVREALGGFMPAYLPGVRFGSVLGGDHQRPPTPDVLTTLGGVHFLAVDKQSYLRIQVTPLPPTAAAPRPQTLCWEAHRLVACIRACDDHTRGGSGGLDATAAHDQRARDALPRHRGDGADARHRPGLEWPRHRSDAAALRLSLSSRAGKGGRRRSSRGEGSCCGGLGAHGHGDEHC